MSDTPRLDSARAQKLVDEMFGDSIVPTLVEYVKIPNKSPMFDPDWEANGHMKAAAELLSAWCREHAIAGMELETIQLPGRTPVLFAEIPGDRDETVLLYGHFDKQPEMTGWDADLGPWKPVLRDDKLYGRGGADDGYSTFASLAALKVLEDQGASRPRCVLLIEGCEESGSFDLPHYIDHLGDRIGTPSLVVCLDSGCGDYDRLWCTTSLRGAVNGSLRVSLLGEGVHSGDASGVVASSFRVVRQLLDRLEDSATGQVRPTDLYAAIPRERIEQAEAMAEALGEKVFDHLPFHDGTRPVTDEVVELILNRTWRPQLAVTGAEGLPPIGSAGNVMRPETALKLSVRLPPTVSGAEATQLIRDLLERDAPYGARVAFDGAESSDGWHAPLLAPWLKESLAETSRSYFGAEAMYMGEGGTIPFMGMLGAKFPEAQFVITGVLGPGSNAHGPNEFLHLPTARRLTCCVADLLSRPRG